MPGVMGYGRLVLPRLLEFLEQILQEIPAVIAARFQQPLDAVASSPALLRRMLQIPAWDY